MDRLYDKLKEIGYAGYSLELYLVRLLFCLFAEDVNILEYRQFQDLIEQCATRMARTWRNGLKAS